MAADAAAFVEADRLIHTLSITPIRVALTAEQVAAYELPTAPPKASDSRAAGWRGGTCQLEALAPDDLAEIVHEVIDELFHPGVLHEQILGERADRIDLLRALPAATGGDA